METSGPGKKSSSKSYDDVIEKLEVTTLDGKTYEYVPVTREKYIEMLEGTLSIEAERLSGGGDGVDYSSLSLKDFLNMDLGGIPKMELPKFTKVFQRTYGIMNMLNEEQGNKSVYFAGTNCSKVMRLKADVLKWSEFWDGQEHYRIFRKDGRNSRGRRELYKWDSTGRLEKKYVETSYQEFSRAVDKMFQEIVLEGDLAYLDVIKALRRVQSVRPEFDYTGELPKESSFADLLGALLLLNKSADVFSERPEELVEVDQYSGQLINFLEKASSYAQCSDAKMVEGMIYFLSKDGDPYYCDLQAYEEFRKGVSELLTTAPRRREPPRDLPEYYL
jgi:hypothetical protein